MNKTIAIATNLVLLIVLWVSTTNFQLETVVMMYVLFQLILFCSHLAVLYSAAEPVDLMDGLNILNAGFFFHFTLAPALICWGLLPTIYHSLWHVADMPRALFFTHAACVLVQLGYYFPLGVVFRNPFDDLQPKPGRIALFLILLAATVAMAGMVPFLDIQPLLSERILRSGPFVIFISMTFY